VIGADTVLTIPAGWQRFVSASREEVKRRIYELATPDVLAELSDRVGKSRRVCEQRGFTASCDELIRSVARTTGLGCPRPGPTL